MVSGQLYSGQPYSADWSSSEYGGRNREMDVLRHAQLGAGVPTGGPSDPVPYLWSKDGEKPLHLGLADHPFGEWAKKLQP